MLAYSNAGMNFPAAVKSGLAKEENTPTIKPLKKTRNIRVFSGSSFGILSDNRRFNDVEPIS